MPGRAVARGEYFPRNDEGRHIGPEIAEKVRQAKLRDKRLGIALMMMEVRFRTRINASFLSEGDSNELSRNRCWTGYVLPRIASSTANTAKPIDWIGFRPQTSMRVKVA